MNNTFRNFSFLRDIDLALKNTPIAASNLGYNLYCEVDILYDQLPVVEMDLVFIPRLFCYA